MNVPTSRPLYTKESFLLKLDTRVIETANIDYRVYRHASDAEHENRTEKADGTKRSEIVRDKNPYTETVDNCLDDSSDDEKRPKVHANPIAVNPVLFAIYTPSERTLWVSVDGHGAGFLYEYDFDSPKPINATMIPGKNNMSPTTIKVLYVFKLRLFKIPYTIGMSTKIIYSVGITRRVIPVVVTPSSINNKS